jgi:hypothetical protein
MSVFTRENNVKKTHMFLADLHLFSNYSVKQINKIANIVLINTFFY